MVSVAAAAVLPLHANRLPPDVKGLRGYEASDCERRDSDGLLTIEDRAILFFASGYDIIRLVRRRDGSLRASGLRSEEGEAGRTRDAVTVKLLTPERLHVATRYSVRHVYHRCRNPPRFRMGRIRTGCVQNFAGSARGAHMADVRLARIASARQLQ
jgi:hypothetical protein